MIMDICGDLGSGKTLLLTMVLKKDFDSGLNIMSNYTLHEPYFKQEKINPLDIMSFGNLENCSMGLDEAWTFLDSRINSKAGRLSTYYFLQSRKRNVRVYYTAQLRGSVDLRLRNLSDRTFLCECIGNPLEPDGFKYTLFNKTEIIRRWKFSIDDVEPYFKMYDTTELIYPMELLGFYDVTVEDLNEIFEMSQKKGTFRTILRGEYPTVTIDTANAVYDLLTIGDERAIKRIKKLMRIE